MASSMEKVSEKVCEQHGHRIGVLEAAGKVLCLACGMSLTEIRGDAERPGKSLDFIPPLKAAHA